MGLTSTLFTGLSGLNANQTKLNVVGNNIANANTVSFKSSRALFKPQFYITDQAGSPPSTDFGGTNPSQRGLGAVVSTIERNFAPGSIEPTGKDTDLAIDGNGFFIVKGKDQTFTRDGSFNLNQNNQLVTVSGDFVQGFGVDSNGNVVTGSVQNLTIPLGASTKAKATTVANLSGNLNASGAVASGASVLKSQSLIDISTGVAPVSGALISNLRDASDNTKIFANVGDKFILKGKRGGRDLSSLTFDVGAGSTVDDFSKFMQQGMAIQDFSSSPPTPVPGVTLDADSTGAHFTVTGNMGTANSLEISGAGLVRTDSTGNLIASTTSFTADPTVSTPTGESVFTSFQAYDSLGTPISVNMTAVLDSKSDGGTTWRYFATSANDSDAAVFDPTAPSHPGSLVGTGTISFDNNGKLITKVNPSITIDRKNTGAGTPLAISLDFSKGMTALSDTSSNMIAQQDGQKTGTLGAFSIGANGIITGSYDNGLTQTLGQVAIATFDNQQGLVDKGGNTYAAGADSGAAKITSPLQLTAGAIRSGSLESSNVDLSAEFINLIIASTGFSAASKVITTSDQLIQQLLNSTR